MQPNSPNEPLQTLGNEDTPLKKELLTLERSPLEKYKLKEKMPRDKKKKNTPILMSNEDFQAIYERKKKLKTREPFRLPDRSCYLAVASDNKHLFFSPVSDPRTIIMFDLQTKQQVHSFKNAHRGQVVSLALTSDNRFLISSDTNHSIQVFDLETKELIQQFESDRYSKTPMNLSVTSDCKYLIAEDRSSFKVLDLIRNKQVHFENRGSSFFVTTSDGRLITSGIRILNLETKQHGHIENKDSFKSVVLTSDDKLMIGAVSGGSIKIFDLEAQQEIHHFEKAHGGKAITSVVVTPNNKFIISASDDKSIKIFDLATKQEVGHIQNAHQASISSLTVTSDSRFIITGCNHSIKVFDLKTQHEVYHFQNVGEYSISSVTLTSDNRFIVSNCRRGSIEIFDFETKEQICPFEFAHKEITSIAVTPNNKYIISGSKDKSIKIFDRETQQEVCHLKDIHSYQIKSLTVTADSRFMISSDGSLNVFDLETKEQVHHFEGMGHTDCIVSVAVTPDSKFIISGWKSGSIKVLELQTKKEIHHFQDVHTGVVTSVAVTSDKRFIISGSKDKSVKVFDLATQKELHHFQNVHESPINAVAVTSDNRFVISSSEDSSMKVFDLQTKQQVHHFQKAHQGNTNSIALTPDDKFLISCGNYTLSVYDFETKQQVLFIQTDIGTISSMAVTGNPFIIIGFYNGSIARVPLEPMQTDLDPENAIIPSSSSAKESLFIPDPSIFNQELCFVYKGMRKFTSSTTLDSFLFDKSSEYSVSQAVRYSDIFVFPFRWTILHIVSVYAKHDFIERMPEYSQFKMPFLVDASNNTPLHYLIAHKNVVSITVNIMFRYICDYLQDSYSKSPYEFQRTIESMTSLLPFIFEKIEMKSRQRFLRIIYSKSPTPYNNPVPTFGKILSESALSCDSPVLTQETRDKIWNEKGATQVEFRSNFLCLDYDILSQDMNIMINCLQTQEGEEIFKMPVIMRLIDHLWGQAETPLMIFFALYSAFIIALSVYLTFDDRSLPYEITLLVVSVLLTASEFWQVFHLRMGYLEDLWNWLDLAHLILTISFLITRIADNDNELARAWISAIIIISGYIRWISLLKIFKPTRNLIQVVIKIIKDMVSFIVIIALIIIAFSLIFLVFNREAGYGDYLYEAYNVLYGPLDIAEDAAWPFSQKLLMAVLAFFLNVVLLNLLISIMGDSYGQVLEMRDRTDALTRLEMIAEAVVYKKFFKPNHKTKRGSLVDCLPLELEENEDDQIQELDKSIQAIKGLIQQNNDESKQESQTFKENLNKKFSGLENEMLTMKNEMLEMKNEIIATQDDVFYLLKEEIANLAHEFSKLRTSGYHPTSDFSKKQVGNNSNIALKKDLSEENEPEDI